MRKGLHAPRYSEVEFPGYPSICRQKIRSTGKGLPSNGGILSGLIPFSYTNRYRTSHISFTETYPIP